MEEFREIKGYEGKYLVSNKGRIKSICNYHKKGDLILKQYEHVETEYLFVRLSQGYLNDKKRTVYKNHDVHRLVAETFIENPDDLPFVNHKDENKRNNNADNLEWCTPKYNSNYGTIKEKICKKVCQYNKEGQFIREYPSLYMAADCVGGYPGNISSCCKGKLETAYGFVWKYA